MGRVLRDVHWLDRVIDNMIGPGRRESSARRFDQRKGPARSCRQVLIGVCEIGDCITNSPEQSLGDKVNFKG